MMNCLCAALAVRLNCVLRMNMSVPGGGRFSLHSSLKMRLNSLVLGIHEGRRYIPLFGMRVDEVKVRMSGVWVVWRRPSRPPMVAVAEWVTGCSEVCAVICVASASLWVM